MRHSGFIERRRVAIVRVDRVLILMIGIEILHSIVRISLQFDVFNKLFKVALVI